MSLEMARARAELRASRIHPAAAVPLDFSGLLASSFIRNTNRLLTQKYGSKRLPSAKGPRRIARGSSADTVKRPQVTCFTINVYSKEEKKDYLRILSRKESLDLVAKFNYLHLKNYFEQKLAVQGGAIVFLQDVRLALDHYELDDPRMVYQRTI
jgi:hypothetical protein